MDSMDKCITSIALVFVIGLFGFIFVFVSAKESYIKDGMQKSYSASDIQAICKF